MFNLFPALCEEAEALLIFGIIKAACGLPCSTSTLGILGIWSLYFFSPWNKTHFLFRLFWGRGTKPPFIELLLNCQTYCSTWIIINLILSAILKKKKGSIFNSLPCWMALGIFMMRGRNGTNVEKAGKLEISNWLSGWVADGSQIRPFALLGAWAQGCRVHRNISNVHQVSI